MKRKAISRQLWFCAVAFLAALSLAASEHHGIVKFGSVPVPGATVTATKDDKKLVTVTDETGAYSFPDLEDGTWKVQVDMLTFAPQTKDIGVAAGLPGAQWDLKMLSMDELKSSLQAAPAPAAPSTPAAGAATPAATAPATPSLAAAAAATQAPKGKGKKSATPATPQPGFQRADVNASGSGGDAAPAGAASSAPPSVAEAQSSSDAFVVNGSTSNGIERRAIGNGRKGPRSQFSGGIDFRGFDTDIWDARSYSITGQDTPRSPYTHFTAGGFLQGPLWIPHLFRWQGNFSLQYSTNRNRSATNTPQTMPTEAEREGDFQGVANIVDPTTKQPFPNNIIPANEISAQAKYFLNFYPLPQFTPTTPLGYNFEEPVISRSVTDQFSTRVNKPINNKSRVDGQFGMQRGGTNSDNLISWQDVIQFAGYHANLAYNRNFTRTFYGRFFLDYQRYSVRTTPFFANKTNVSGDAGVEGNDQTPGNWGPPGLGFTNFFGLGDANENFLRNQTPWVGGIITYIHRPHNFQFGGDFKVQDLSTVGQSNGRGSLSFNGSATAGCYYNPANCPAGTSAPTGGAANCATGGAGTANCVSGFDFADFLLGIPDVISLSNGNPDKYLHSNLFDAYINDNWNVNSSLTLQWGVRWEYASPFTEEYGRLANLDIAPGYTAAEPVTAQSPIGPLTGMHYGSSLLRPDRHEISPRVSVAWRPIFGSSMVVRAGYGIYYNTSFYNGIAAQMDSQGPFAKSLSMTNPDSSLTMANAFSTPAVGAADVFAVDPNIKVGYTHQYNFSVQQNLTSSILLTASYAGVKGTRTLQEFQPNTAAPGDTAITPCAPCYTYLVSNGNSNRNAGNLQLRRRFHAGLSTTLNYTFAKAIDDSGGLLSYGGGNNGVSSLSLASPAQNWLNLAGERGPSNSDQRHLLALSFQYSTGVGMHGGALLSGWRGVILKGWTFQSNISVGSGLPFTPIWYQTLEGSGAGVVRPEYVGGNVYDGAGGLFLNPAAFAAPPAGQFGDVGRNSLYGPNQFSMGGSMARSFQDKYTVTFAATNILNHPVYSSVYNSMYPTVDSAGTLSYGKFGQFLPPSGMRQITATFRWTF